MKKQDINIDEIITVGAELISDSEPKTTAGKVLRWIKKIVRFKNLFGIKIKASV